MGGKRTYHASCHCGTVRFEFEAEPITTGIRCNCSICRRKGAVMSAGYFKPEEIEPVQGLSFLTPYQFGDRDLKHYFCRTCGIFTFSVVASVPPDYDGPAAPGNYRINLGCVEEIDLETLDVAMVDGRSF